jgi:hypothetical protein
MDGWEKEAEDKKAKDEEEDPAIAADKKAKDESEEEKKSAEDKKAMDAAIKSAVDSAVAPLLETINVLKSGATKAVIGEVRRRDDLAKQLSNFGVAVDTAEMTLPELQVVAVEKLGLKCEKGQEQIALDGYFHDRKLPSDEIGFAIDAKSKEQSTGGIKKFLTAKAA